MPVSSLPIRPFTDSFASIQFMLKCLPISRSKSSDESFPHQSRLSRTCGVSPVFCFTKLIICSFIHFLRWATSSSEKTSLSLSFPLGSPIIPVAPPSRNIGLCPAFSIRTKLRSGMRFPICKLSAVGSKPQYMLFPSTCK